jgi:hypothetical protein
VSHHSLRLRAVAFLATGERLASHTYRSTNLRRRLGERRSAQPPIVLLVVFALFGRYQLLPSLPATAVAVLLGTTGEPPVALRRRQRRAFDQSEDLVSVQKFNPVKQHGR